MNKTTIIGGSVGLVIVGLVGGSFLTDSVVADSVYEKIDNSTLKVVESVESTLKIDDLKKDLALLQEQKERSENSCLNTANNINSEISKIESLINEAFKLGIE